jgi:hypothetical protein
MCLAADPNFHQHEPLGAVVHLSRRFYFQYYRVSLYCLHFYSGSHIFFCYSAEKDSVHVSRLQGTSMFKVGEINIVLTFSSSHSLLCRMQEVKPRGKYTSESMTKLTNSLILVIAILLALVESCSLLFFLQQIMTGRLLTPKARQVDTFLTSLHFCKAHSYHLPTYL